MLFAVLNLRSDPNLDARFPAVVVRGHIEHFVRVIAAFGSGEKGRDFCTPALRFSRRLFDRIVRGSQSNLVEIARRFALFGPRSLQRQIARYVTAICRISRNAFHNFTFRRKKF
jgi:hypothetical protein